MAYILALILYAALMPPGFALSTRHFFAGVVPWEVSWAVVGGLIALITATFALWPPAIPAAANCVLGIFLYWWNRRKRGRAKAWASNKWRAIRDAMVRKQRRAERRRPVWRPVPQAGGA